MSPNPFDHLAASQPTPLSDPPSEPRTPTVIKARAFLAAYRATCNVTRSAKAAGIGPRRHYVWLEKYPKYKAAFARAQRVAAGMLKDKAVEGATEGWLEPVFFQGAPCGAVRRFDMGMRQVLLRGLLSEEFGAKVDHNVYGSVEIVERLQAARNRLAKAAPAAA